LVSDAVDRLLQKKPEDRFPDMAAAAAALAAAADACGLDPVTETQAVVSAPTPVPAATPFPAATATVPDAAAAITFDLPAPPPEAEPITGRPRKKDRTVFRTENPTPLTISPEPVEMPPAVRPIVLKGKSGGVTETPRPAPLSDAALFAPPAPPNPVAWSSAPIVDPTNGPIRRPTSAFASLLRRIFLFWKPPADTVQLTLCGPTRLVAGQSAKFQVFAHHPAQFASVRTLARAFAADADAIATGMLEHDVGRGQKVGLHLALGNAGISDPLLAVTWAGQTLPRTFNVFVPWESPPGPAPGILSAGLDGVRVAEIPFQIQVTPRRG
jgi:hypothetical protein